MQDLIRCQPHSLVLSHLDHKGLVEIENSPQSEDIT